MNELILEALRLLLMREIGFPVYVGDVLIESESSSAARSLLGRIDAMLGVLRQDRGERICSTPGCGQLAAEQVSGEFWYCETHAPNARWWHRVEPFTDSPLEAGDGEDRKAAPPAAYRPHNWHWDRRPWSGDYAFWCGGCGVWSAADGSLPEGPCPGRRETEREREAGGGG